MESHANFSFSATRVLNFVCLRLRLKTRTVEMDHERSQYELFLSAACELVIEHKTIIQVWIMMSLLVLLEEQFRTDRDIQYKIKLV